MNKNSSLVLCKYNFNKLINSISTIIFLVLIGVASLILSICILLPPGFSNGVNAVGLNNYYLIWIIIVLPINLVFVFLKTCQLIRDEIDDGTMLILITKKISRSSIYYQKLLSVFLITLVFVACQGLFPLLLGFVHFSVYGYNGALLAFGRWSGMILSLIVINLVFIGLAIFCNLIFSSKIIITIAALLALISVPGTLSDMLIQMSSDHNRIALINQQSVMQETYELNNKYYVKNNYLQTILNQGIEQKSLSWFYQNNLKIIFAPCGELVEHNGEVDVNNSFSKNNQDITPILDNLKDVDQIHFIKLFWSFAPRYEFKINNKEFNVLLALWKTIESKLNNYVNLLILSSNNLPQGISIDEYVNSFNSYNNLLMYNSWFNPLKQWNLMFGEFNIGFNNLKEFQGFPYSEYVGHYIRNQNGDYQLNLSKIKTLHQPVIFNFLWVIVGVLIITSCGIWFNKKDIT